MIGDANDSRTTLVSDETDNKSLLTQPNSDAGAELNAGAQADDAKAPSLDLDNEVRINLGALAHLDKPIGLDASRCFDKPTLLSINKAPCWKMGNFSVHDVETGQPVFECKSRFNIHCEKGGMNTRLASYIYDATGKHLFNMSTKFWSMSRRTTVTHPDGSEAFVVEAEAWASRPQLHATFTDQATSKAIELYLDGTYKRGKGRIEMDGQEVAQLYRERLFKDERRVVIAPNADTALIFAITLVFDMILYELVASSSILAPVIMATSY